MTLPERNSQKRRPQILDDETLDGRHFDMREDENAGTHQDSWPKNFVARLARLVRKTGYKSPPH
jgi:hypothetical protein